MVGYKLFKNDWVTSFFVIFRSVREILLVTVFLEHPVLQLIQEKYSYSATPPKTECISTKDSDTENGDPV